MNLTWYLFMENIILAAVHTVMHTFLAQSVMILSLSAPKTSKRCEPMKKMCTEDYVVTLTMQGDEGGWWEAAALGQARQHTSVGAGGV